MTDAATNFPSGESDSGRPALSFDHAVDLDFAESSETNEREEEERQSTKLGYLRERDYRHKTQELGNKGRNLETMTTRVATTANAIAEFLIQQLPAEPTRMLAIQNPAEYTRQKSVYDGALEQVQRLIDVSAEPKRVGDELKQAATQETLAAENAKLLEAFPRLAREDARERFFAEAFKAGEDFGFSQDEMQGFTDHRYFKVMHYAMLGFRAEQAKSKALTKVANAPPATAKSKPKGPANPQARKNQDAMKRLAKTGSIKDALLIDFE